MIRTTISKVQNNPVSAIIGGVATYYLVNKKMPNSKMRTNPYIFAGVVLLGVVAGAYVSSYIKNTTNNPIAL